MCFMIGKANPAGEMNVAMHSAGRGICMSRESPKVASSNHKQNVDNATTQRSKTTAWQVFIESSTLVQ